MRVKNPFFMLVPDELLYPMVGLATAATVIASQAVISGAFSLTSQAMQLGYCPRIQVRFTSEREKGQIYIPNINWLLLLAVIILVLGFRSSSNLASAYGIAVTMTMMIDTLLAFVVVRALWNWNWLKAGLFLTLFIVVDFAFFSANLVKVLDGGWFPLLLGSRHNSPCSPPGSAAARCSTNDCSRTPSRSMRSSPAFSTAARTASRAPASS